MPPKKSTAAQIWENRVVRVATLIVTLAAVPPAVVVYWPSPTNAEFQKLRGESIDNTIERLQRRVRFLEAESVKATNASKKAYWKSELAKAKRSLDQAWMRKFSK